MKTSISIISLFLLLSSCAYHIGVMNSNPNFSSPGYELTQLAVGTASTEKYFGIGGLNKDALVLEAKKNLYSTYPLKKGQSYANMTVDFKNTFVLIYNKTTVTISADVVQVNNKQEFSDSYQPIFNQIRDNQKLSSGNISLGDTVMTYSFGVGKNFVVTKILPEDKFIINSVDGKISESKNANKLELYLTKDIKSKITPFHIGQEVSVKNVEKHVNGKIVALGEISAIVEVVNGKSVIYLKRNFNKIKNIDI